MAPHPGEDIVRDDRLDSAKFVLISLVVFGHLLEGLRHVSVGFDLAYRVVYLFHMPAFVFLSGLVSSEVIDARRARRLLATVVIPLLIFQALGPAWEAWLKGGDFRYNLVQPWWILWYLASLVLWRLSLPLLIGSGIPLVLSIAISLGSGWRPEIGYAFSLARTATFLPFFVAGYLYATRRGRALPTLSMPVAAVLLGGVCAVGYFTSKWPVSWLYGSVDYQRFAAGNVEGVALRTLQLVTGFAGTYAVLGLIPRGGRVLAWLGAGSMAAFLLHAFVVKAVVIKGWYGPLATLPVPIALVATMVVAVALAVACSIAGNVFKPAFDYGWLWRKPKGATEIESASRQAD